MSDSFKFNGIIGFISVCFNIEVASLTGIILTFFINSLSNSITSLSLTLIVWVIQSVNYLDFVSEDGHSMKVYLM